MLRINPNFVLRKIYDVYLLIPVRRNSISTDVISLNSTAGLIFEECEKADNVSDLVDKVLQYFDDIDSETVRDGFLAYTEALIDQGFLEWRMD